MNNKHISLLSTDDIDDIKKNGKNLSDELIKKMLTSTKTKRPDQMKENLATIHALMKKTRMNMKQMRDFRKTATDFKEKHKHLKDDELVNEYVKQRNRGKN